MTTSTLTNLLQDCQALLLEKDYLEVILQTNQHFANNINCIFSTEIELLYLARIQSLIKLNEFERAYKEIKYIIAQNNNSAQAYYFAGLIEYKQSNYQRAEICFDTAIDCDNTHMEAYSNRGIVRHILGKYDDAIQDAKTAGSLIKSNSQQVLNNIF